MKRFLANAVLLLALGALCLAALFAFNRLAAPQPCILPPSGVRPPGYRAISVAITEESLGQQLQMLCAEPSRFTGEQASWTGAAGNIVEGLRESGYAVVDQLFHVTVPGTSYAELYADWGGYLDDIGIYPLLPNWFRTATIPDGGLSGKVYRGEKGLAREFKDVDLRGNFVLLPIGTSWATVAGMGARAVLYYDDGKKLAGARWGDHVDASVNLPRFLVTGNAESLSGKTVTIKTRVEWNEEPVRNIVAILDVPNAEGEAIVVNAYHDAYSYAPDLAPGAQQACGIAALLSLARHLAREKAHLRRPVILVVTTGHGQGLAGVREFIAALGTREGRAEALHTATAAEARALAEMDLAKAAAFALGDERAQWAATTRQFEDAYWASKPPELRDYVTELLKGMLDMDLMSAVEGLTQARTCWVRDGLPVRGPGGKEAESFLRYNEARKQQLAAQAALSAPPWKLTSMWRDYLLSSELRPLLALSARKRADVLSRAHAKAESRAALARKLAPYQRLLFVGLDLTARSGRVGLVCGEPKQVPACMPADAEVAAQFLRAAEGLQKADPSTSYVKTKKGQPRFANLLRENDTKDLGFATEWYGAPSYFESLAALWAGYPAFSLVTLDDNREMLGTPFDTLENLLKPPASPDEEPPLRNLAVVTRLITAAVSQLARGHGRIVPLARGSDLTTIRGEVVAQVGDSLVPNHPMPGALVRFGPPLVWGRPTVVPPGVGTDWVVTADWRGRFELPCVWPTALSQDWWAEVDIDAAVVRPEDGEVTWTLSTPKSGEGAPYAVRRVRLAHYRKSQATAVVFRAAPVQLFPMADPATLRPYAGFDFIETKSLAPPQEFKVESAGGANVCFVPPDSRLFFTFKKGQRRNPSLMEIRAFALGATGPADTGQRPVPPTSQGIGGGTGVSPVKDTGQRPVPPTTPEKGGGTGVPPVKDTGQRPVPPTTPEKGGGTGVPPVKDTGQRPAPPSDQEIQGKGYLAADTPSITNIELDAALSMAQTNARRTRLQARYGMADDMVLRYNERAAGLADQAQRLAAAGKVVDAKRTASESLAYSSNIHPVIRKNASDAVWGILFYLLLAIPFALFLEKLLVGHPDLRWQVAVQGIIFVLFFLALRVVHPACQLVRSSFMILLGFVTFALAALVTVFLAGRFRENVAELNRRLQERAEATDVSRAGAMATAFVLGLSNLRKRPVRTALTVGTLILTTFVMLGFASIGSDVVDVEFALGKAHYTGLLVRDRGLRDVADALAPLRELYGEDHIVVQRDWAGSFEVPWGRAPELAEFTVASVAGGKTLEAKANAFLGLSQQEPELTPVKAAFQTIVRWFNSNSELACFLPRAMADRLQVSDEAVKAGAASVSIGGRQYAVLGIFDGQRLDGVTDLDGEPLLPMDITAVRTPAQGGGGAYSEEATETPERVPRLAADRVVIFPVEALPSRALTASVAVALRGLDYRAAREAITTHLERSAEPTYYGLDGVAFYGGKFRMQSLEGVLELLLPILIAALTVLNTMRGSVYERRGELYVFNAVGLSPNHIRSLFLAEASVYAVVGAVGGYLLAQGASTALKAAGLTAGLTMNYSSLASVLVSVVIIAVVLLSSLYPARLAARLAAPAETMTRRRESAEGDALELDLPFTFNRRDRVAIVPYFVDWFENYGEGSAGEFFCSPPLCGIRAEADGSAAPFVETTTWLKPYDLGVSQTVSLVVREKDSRSLFPAEKTPGVFFSRDNVATVVMARKSGDKDSWERCAHAFIGLLRKRFLTWRAIPDEERQRLLERGRRLLEGPRTRDS
ncbi:MAG: FtsX-like permease family protein [Planctomycetes bacterium]|nr:FtsX-like permease family protein [Planctomycetota bacterium]